MKIAVLGSTRGSTFGKLLEERPADQLPGKCCLVISDKEDAGILSLARERDIPTRFISPAGKSRREWDAELDKLLTSEGIDLVLLMGFMRILGEDFVQRWRGKVVNVHPSLLPRHKGLMNEAVHQAVLDAGESVSGASLHWVTEALDGGQVILQKIVQVDEGETVASLKEKVQAVEPELFGDFLDRAYQRFQAGPFTERKEDQKRRRDRFRSLGYGLFLHWGLYSHVGRGEWYRFHHRVPASEYEPLIDQFDAAGFSAPEWAKWAKKQGFGYVCLTTRHHDGFSLYDTRGLNTFDAPHSPAGRDLVKEFSDACRAEGLGVFFYHTTLDWRHPDFDGNWGAYLDYLKESVEILCRHYGKVDGFWFDGNWARRERDWAEADLYRMIRTLQPDTIIVNNSSLEALGAEGHPMTDVLTFEQGIPKKGKTGGSKVAEMCDTLNSHWGQALRDYSYQSPASLIRKLARCRSIGANYLINIGPNPDGSIPALEKALLEKVADWMKPFGEVLKTALPSPIQAEGGDFVLDKGTSSWVFCDNLPITNNGHLAGSDIRPGWRRLSPVKQKPSKVYWLGHEEELDWTYHPDGQSLFIHFTANPYGSQEEIRVARIDW